MSEQPTTVYVNANDFELLPGDAIECPVVWRLPLIELTLTLRVSLVADRVVRLDSRRILRRKSAWRILRAARAEA